MRIAIDLGGTNICAAKVEKGICSEVTSIPCNAKGTEDMVISQIKELISSLSTEKTEGIGIGVPSVVDVERGIVYNACNIPSWREVHLKEKIEDAFGVRTEVNNDCNCFALGEYLYGAGKGCDNMVGITLGTGVGAGVIVNGRLYSGYCAGAGEIGSLPFRSSDYEHYCSSLFLNDVYNTNGAELAARIAAGDTSALDVWSEFGRNLGELINAILFTYAPDAVVIGGGIVASMKYFEESMRATVSGFPYERISSHCRILPAMLREANLLGAASLLD